MENIYNIIRVELIEIFFGSIEFYNEMLNSDLIQNQLITFIIDLVPFVIIFIILFGIIIIPLVFILDLFFKVGKEAEKNVFIQEVEEERKKRKRK